MWRRISARVPRAAVTRAASSSAPSQTVVVEEDCSWRQVGMRVSGHGHRCLVIQGGSDRAQGQAQRSLFELRKAGVQCVTCTVRDMYPSAAGVDEGLDMARRVGAASVVGIGGGAVVDTAKAVALLHGSRRRAADFLLSPSEAIMAGGSRAESRQLGAGALPLVAVPTSFGAGAAASGQCLVWHPQDELLVPVVRPAAGPPPLQTVALVDPLLTKTVGEGLAMAMALTALSACLDGLLCRASRAGRADVPPGADPATPLSVQGIAALAEGLPAVLADPGDVRGRKQLAVASMCAGQVACITPAPPCQVLARAAGSLLYHQRYPEVCAIILPHLVQAVLEKTQTGWGTHGAGEAAAKVLGQAASTLTGETGADGATLLLWLQRHSERLRVSHLADLEPAAEAGDMANSVRLLMTVEEAGKGVLDLDLLEDSEIHAVLERATAGMGRRDGGRLPPGA